MKTKLFVAALTAVPAAAAAESSITLSGQVNVAALGGSAVDDLTIVDNNTSGSRFRILASKGFGNGFSAGLRFELQAQFAQSNDPTEIGLNSGAADGTVREVRYADTFIDGIFGKIAIGRGDGAANDTSESYGLLNFLGGAEGHLLFDGVGNDFSDVDGLSRQNRIRYDTPSFSGLSGAISFDEQSENELGLRYDQKFDVGTVRARAGITIGDGDQQTVDVSFAYKFPFGLGFAYSHGSFEDTTGRTISENDWVQVSYDIGKHWVLSAGYGSENEFEADFDEVVDNDLTILSVIWKPVDGAQIYLNFGDWDNGIASGEVEEDNDDSSAFALGALISF